ncbi:hypothetical protein PLICRDRAFT_34644 [Plicaturopsis crispa FD-325 SS-3]|nr:hypothetical protein PLICRDRAFT_34644 [Plicaturopsis crispa FD-325 SS-3]
MAFDANSLEPAIRRILSAPGTDLTTISAKRVRKHLLEVEPSVTAEILKANKDAVDAVIASVFEKVSAENGGGEDDDGEEDGGEDAGSGKRKRGSEGPEYYHGGEPRDDEGEEDGEAVSPPAKKAKKVKRGELTDAELARQLSSEINGRARRSTGTRGRTANGTPKKNSRKKKSAATVDSGEDDSGEEGEKKPKTKKKKAPSEGGGTARGGFSKEYLLSEPLASVIAVDKLSRPQVVKQLWQYIKGNNLQNPDNKREIICDPKLKAVFNTDKIDMFRMNKVLGEHLHEPEE